MSKTTAGGENLLGRVVLVDNHVNGRIVDTTQTGDGKIFVCVNPETITGLYLVKEGWISLERVEILE